MSLRVLNVLLRGTTSKGVGLGSLFRRAVTSFLDLEDEEHLKLNPRTTTSARIVPTSTTVSQEQPKWKRNEPLRGKELKGNFECPILSERGAVFEATRCLQCADAPCRKSCPAQIDIKSFIGQIVNKNYYGAAKTILTDNPLGMSCGLVCATSSLCAAACNLNATEEGPIRIGELQHYATSVFGDMAIPPAKTANPAPHRRGKKIALIGGGPASMSCAAFLARLGYEDVTILEKKEYLGGIHSGEVPAHRLPIDCIQFEEKMLRDSGVKVEYGKVFGESDGLRSLQEVKQSLGVDAVFIGVGLPIPKVHPSFQKYSPKEGVWTSKEFLGSVADGTKRSSSTPPTLRGHVVVFGAGDTAMDCASSAFRCGADEVTVAFRRGTSEIRAHEEDLEACREEGVDFLPCVEPSRIRVKNGKVVGVDMYHLTRDPTTNKYKKDGSRLRVQCDHVISAFGSEIGATSSRALRPVLDNKGLVSVDIWNQSSRLPWVFAGGDVVGSTASVAAVNDGKTAAAGIDKYLMGGDCEPVLPVFHTRVDDIDLSVEMAGVHFPNPFGLSSAPPTTSSAMIKRAFEAGWGFSVSKTFSLDKDLITNVSPRIVRGTTHSHLRGPHQSSFLNIELISEKTMEYWCESIRELKSRFPEKVVVGSIMCGYDKGDWQELARNAAAASPDIIELNLSCPHMPREGAIAMGSAIGQVPESVGDICRWVKEVVPSNIPVFAKLTPNISDVVVIAQAAHDNGADGVTAINTISGLMGLRGDGNPHPGVGHGVKKESAYGGVSGNATRPVALKMISAISHSLPGFPIMGVGGVDSADTALQFLRAGASVVQICSSVQNQDFTIINDLMSGLRAQMYLEGNSELYPGWDAQSPPPVTRGHVAVEGRGLPRFGVFEQQRREIVSQYVMKNKEVGEGKVQLLEKRSSEGSVDNVPRLSDLIASSVPLIKDHTYLTREEHVVAEVNPDRCVNCGKCFMVCNDSGYQAIDFDAETHVPFVTEECTGCCLCSSVCPIPDCIDMVKRDSPYVPKRGTTGH